MNEDIFQIMQTEKELASYDKEDKVISFKEMQELAEKNKAHIFAIKSDIPSLDGMVGGFEGGELNVISGKTGGGKTLFAQTLTKNFSDQGIKSLWFSYEMPPYNFLKRFPSIPEAYMPQILTARDPRWIEARIWEAKLKYDTRIVFIDHLHYLVDMARMQNMSIEIGEIMRSLKKIAIKHNIVLFLIAHTKMTNEDDELGLGSVRDSGMIECEADNVFYVWRNMKRDIFNQSILKIAKNRKLGIVGKKIDLQFVNGYLMELEKRTDEEKSQGANLGVW